ncbi:Sec-independent protein translocase subunit TatA [Actinospica sp. MGRD01-02]|uniref:Sec-independent protein translocase protein TatA n=1 Tax=Actinospica acidithermotolerans TaxID=2828514 RepID=A0A941IIY6_9ACTN|nr:Sec-independent protein translocase subunit TatA [Actinospica acidithermotolerans]MBR7827277.1 Sec-independent protein translocase subunit TatA [Actinospica acidithermotolerans]
MFRGGLEPWHVIVILALIVLLFGSRKLPDAARSVGQSLRIFKSEMKAAKDDGASAPAQPQAAPQAVESSVVPPAQPVTDSVPSHDAAQR